MGLSQELSSAAHQRKDAKLIQSSRDKLIENMAEYCQYFSKPSKRSPIFTPKRALASNVRPEH